MWVISVIGEAGDQGLEDGNVDRPDLRGCRVLIIPGLEKGFELDDIVGAIQLGIQEAQLGKHLSHGM